MSDILIREIGNVGRITFTRPDVLNAMTYDMCVAIEGALDRWRVTPDVAMIVIDAEGEKAFCAGGDIAELYDSGMAGNFAFGQKFWADEYRMNAKMAAYPKPVVSFMQGFTMGGGVGVGCHCSHRVVCQTSKIAMPEVGIGLVPDVGGTALLANAPGHIGEYLGTTGFRMGPDDAIYVGFADTFIPYEHWPELITLLETSGDVKHIAAFAQPAPVKSDIRYLRREIDHHFSAGDFDAIVQSLRSERSEENAAALMAFDRNSPLSMACTIEIINRVRADGGSIKEAFRNEYRFTYRAMEHGDFLEGIRAQIIDKDRKPKWKHRVLGIPQEAIDAMLAPLGEHGLKFIRETNP